MTTTNHLFFDWQSIRRFYEFCKINVSSSNDSLDHSMCMKPHQGIWYFFPSFSYPTTNGFWVEFWVGMKLRHTCITYFAKPKTEPQGDASHTLWSRCASVWNFYNFLILNIFGTPLNHESLFLNECLLFECMGYLYFFLYFSFLFFMLFGMHFFLSCLLAWTFFFFFSFI